jgi:hypothetical protein
MIFYELGGFQTIPNSLYLGTEDILFLMSMMLLVAQGTVGLRAPLFASTCIRTKN